MHIYTEAGSSRNSHESEQAINAHRFGQHISRTYGIPLAVALAAVMANYAVKERHHA